MADTLKIVNNHEQRFVDMDIFQVNTNASLKNLETQVGQLAISLQKQSNDTFPCDTQINPKDCLTVTRRSGKELQESKKKEKKKSRNDKAVKEERNQKLEVEKDATKSSRRDLSEEEKNAESIKMKSLKRRRM